LPEVLSIRFNKDHIIWDGMTGYQAEPIPSRFIMDHPFQLLRSRLAFTHPRSSAFRRFQSRSILTSLLLFQKAHLLLDGLQTILSQSCSIPQEPLLPPAKCKSLLIANGTILNSTPPDRAWTHQKPIQIGDVVTYPTYS
jgi:hypothetical protein